MNQKRNGTEDTYINIGENKDLGKIDLVLNPRFGDLQNTSHGINYCASSQQKGQGISSSRFCEVDMTNKIYRFKYQEEDTFPEVLLGDVSYALRFMGFSHLG